MNWTGEKIQKLCNIYKVTQFEIADMIGVERTSISKIIHHKVDLEYYSELLTAFFEAKREGKIKEHQTMINFYKNINH